jgi:hypothetical protein
MVEILARDVAEALADMGLQGLAGLDLLAGHRDVHEAASPFPGLR